MIKGASCLLHHGAQPTTEKWCIWLGLVKHQNEPVCGGNALMEKRECDDFEVKVTDQFDNAERRMVAEFFWIDWICCSH